MNSSSKVITAQPVISYMDKSSKKTQINSQINSHKNSCEKYVTCNSTAHRYPVSCDEFLDMFKLRDDNDYSGSNNFGMYSCCCFPVTLPFISICCGPCALYNICRNKCNDYEENKSYLC
jgi:hypothetical protein